MARIKYDPLITPIQGIEDGFVLQRGKFGAVMKVKDSGQGQRLRPNLDAQEAIGAADGYWRELTPTEQADWDAATIHFPTVDRYGTPKLSTARELFLRTMARKPIFNQKALASPRGPYAGAPLVDAQLSFVSGALIFEPPPAPAGEFLSVSLFVTIQVGQGKSTKFPSLRRLYFLDNYSGSPSIDLTAEYEALTSPLEYGSKVFWCAKTFDYDSPELLNDVCSYVPIEFMIDFAIRHLADASGTVTRRFYYSGTGTPVVYHNGIDIGPPSLHSGTTFEFDIPYDGTTDQEILVTVDEKDKIFRIDPSWLDQNDLITLADISRLSGPTGNNYFKISGNLFTTIILPDSDITYTMTIQGGGNSNLYPINELVTITGNGVYSDIDFGSFNRAKVDISGLKLKNSFRWLGGGNTTASSNSAYEVIFPVSNTEDFVDFLIGSIYAQPVIDLSLWTGAFSGQFRIANQGNPSLALTEIYLPPNIEAVTYFYIGNSRNLGAFTMDVDNGAGMFDYLRFYRNVLNNNTQQFIVDLTNTNFRTYFEVSGFGTDWGAYSVIFPASNSEDFSWFRLLGWRAANTAILDLDSIFTGAFSGTFGLNYLQGVTEVVLPSDMDAVTSFIFNQMFSLDTGLTIPAITTTLVLFDVYRNDVNATDPSQVLDCSAIDVSTRFRIYSYTDSRPANWYSVTLPSSNSNDFDYFMFANIYNQPTVDFSGWTGAIVTPSNVDIYMWGLTNTTSILLGFSTINTRRFYARRNLALNQAFNIATQIIVSSIFDVSMCAISQTNIETMIDDIAANPTACPSGTRFNFSRSSANSNNSTNIGTNGTPDAAHITTMNNLKTTYGLRFNYWNGASNVVV